MARPAARRGAALRGGGADVRGLSELASTLHKASAAGTGWRGVLPRRRGRHLRCRTRFLRAACPFGPRCGGRCRRRLCRPALLPQIDGSMADCGARI